ncbi:MAG: hypothetical protein IJD97_05385 [Clostridia bacterium]|nr:hypothetical protein [Clostridia bacterium]
MTELEKLIGSLNPSALNKIKDFTKTDEGAKLLKKVSEMSESDKNAVIDKALKDPTILSKIKGML